MAVIAAAVFGWGALSGRLERADLTAPIVFVTVGVVLYEVVTVNPHVETETAKILTEVTLAWVLFSDASQVAVAELRHDANIFVRLLGLSLPLTIVAGWLLAWAMFGGFDAWLALLVGAALAPTDAALGAAVFTNPAVPGRVRSILNVESGLNDGIATPVVLIAIAGTLAHEHSGGGVGHAAVELVLGAAVGAATGAVGGLIIRTTRRRRWIDEQFAGPAVLALALVAYTLAVAAGGNGFVAAFAGGIAFGRMTGPAGPTQVFYVEQTAALASLLVWTVFGLIAVPLIRDALGWQLVIYAILSLTLVRMLPVALVLVGTTLDLRTALFIGWFGPRGLASVVFALIATAEIGAPARTAVAAIATTVLLSVIVHGVTAVPLARRYGEVSSQSLQVPARA